MNDTFLERIIAHKKLDLERMRWVDADVQGAPPPRDFLKVLDPCYLGVIAEIKRASPSKGDIAPDLDAVDQARRYAAGDATAISVLTDQAFYRGDMRDLRAVREAVTTPLLAKDFILDRHGLLQARAHGADMVLLIVAVVGAVGLPVLMRDAYALGMTPLVEVGTEEEAEIALESGAALIGINNRDLRTFKVSLKTTERIAPTVTPHAVVISLSGINSVADAQRMANAGAKAILVGEAFIRARDPAQLISEMRGVPLTRRPQ